MYLQIEDNVNDLRREPLRRREVWIGREVAGPGEPADVRVASNLLKARDLQLLSVGDGWQLTQYGDNPVRLNGETIAPRHAYRLDPGDRFSTPGYVFSIVEDAFVAAEFGVAAVSGSLELFQIQERVHGELLELRKRIKASNQNLDEPEVQEEIRLQLERILDDPGLRIADGDIDLLSEPAMYLRLNRRVILAGTEIVEKMDAATSPGRAFEAQLRSLELAIAADIGLECALRSMEHDLSRMDTEFESAYRRHRLSLNPGLKRYLVESLIVRDICNLIFGLGPLQDLYDASPVTEIMVVGPRKIFVEKAGIIENTRRRFVSEEALNLVIERIVAPRDKSIDRSSPLVDARLADGGRANAVIDPIAVRGPVLTIRKFSKRPIDVETMERSGSLSPTMTRFLRACVAAKKNIVVSGGTGSGKTTLLNALAKFVNPKQRIVTIEDTAELDIPLPHVVSLEARPKNMEGKGEITLQDLVRNALRMRPDRILVGECRGAEALDMLQAMNTGHSGSMTTGHANTPQDMMRRLETMVLMGMEMPVSAIRQQIASAVDLVVQLSRFEDGVRRVTHISEVVGIDEERGDLIVEDIFLFVPEPVQRRSGDTPIAGVHAHTGYMPRFMGELLDRGLLDLATFFGVAGGPDRTSSSVAGKER